MIGSGLPQRTCAGHPLMTDQGIHDGVLEGMPHVQASGHIGRRNYDAVRLAVTCWGEKPSLLPLLVERLLNGMRIETLAQFGLRHTLTRVFSSM